MRMSRVCNVLYVKIEMKKIVTLPPSTQQNPRLRMQWITEWVLRIFWFYVLGSLFSMIVGELVAAESLSIGRG